VDSHGRHVADGSVNARASSRSSIYRDDQVILQQRHHSGQHETIAARLREGVTLLDRELTIIRASKRLSDSAEHPPRPVFPELLADRLIDAGRQGRSWFSCSSTIAPMRRAGSGASAWRSMQTETWPSDLCKTIWLKLP